METSRLNIVLQGVNVEDGARVCSPHFEVFHQKEETKRSRRGFENSAWKSLKQRQYAKSGPVHFRAQRTVGSRGGVEASLSYVAAKESLSSNLSSLVSSQSSMGVSIKHHVTQPKADSHMAAILFLTASQTSVLLCSSQEQ